MNDSVKLRELGIGLSDARDYYRSGQQDAAQGQPENEDIRPTVAWFYERGYLDYIEKIAEGRVCA